MAINIFYSGNTATVTLAVVSVLLSLIVISGTTVLLYNKNRKIKFME